MSVTTYIYEQPLNEQMRLCLRLEYLFQKAKQYSREDSNWDSRIALETIVEIMNAVDRTDIKTKLNKMLHKYAAPLNQLLTKELPEDVDERKLHRILEQLNKLTKTLHTNTGKIGQDLRESDFFYAIQQRLTTPGATCPFNIPSFYAWLQKPSDVRLQNLTDWLEKFSELKAVISLLLKLTRESAIFNRMHAKDGFYQLNLDPKTDYQIIRVAILGNATIYPEISLGRHRISVHFYQFNALGHPPQAREAIDFELACCKI